MFHQREQNWIGIQQAQKALYSLKEEVEIVEKKLYHSKRSFNEQTAKKRISYEDKFPSEGHLKTSQFPKSNVSNKSYFLKEKIVPYNVSLHSDEKVTVPKEIFVASEEEPDIPPSKFPHIEPLDLQQNFMRSFDNLLSTTEDSISVGNVKYSSSEGTSSLIANTYREADKLPKKNETKPKVVETDLSKSSTTETIELVNDYRKKKVFNVKESLPANAGDIGMEWTDVSKNKAFFLQNKFKTDTIHKLKDIIDRQKKRQELYQLQLEKDVLNNFEPHYHKDTHHDLTHQPVPTVKDDQVFHIPVRKVRTVKSFANYKGFSAPPTNLPANKRWRKQRSKHTIANPPNLKNYAANPPKRKAVSKYENKSVPPSHIKEVSKSTKITNKDESFSQAASNIYSETVKESIQDKVSDKKLHDNKEVLKEPIDSKTDSQSVLNNIQLSNEDSLQDVKDTTLSYDVQMQPISSMKDDQNILKENEKPVKPKSSKKKPKVSQEQKIPSPKVKQYDVEKVREYIKKKKEERRKRHLAEHKEKMLEDQKRKKCLEKLIEYQRQNMKAVAKVKPLSPVKISHSNNLITREHENVHENIGMNSPVQDVNTSQEKEIISPEKSKKKLLEEAFQKDDSVKNQVITIISHKRKQDNVPMDIPVSKVISVSVNRSSAHQTTTKIGKDKLILSSETHVESIKTAVKSKPVTKTAIESSVQERVIATTNYQDTGITSIDVDNSYLYKNISSVSTPSGISQITDVDPKLLEEIKVCENPFPKAKKRKDNELKKMIESINEMTGPIEPLLYTKQWLSKNPFPPMTLQSRLSQTVSSSKQQECHHSVKKQDFLLAISQTEDVKESSFKEQISDIGDVSQLYAQILGKKSTNEVVPNFKEKHSTTTNHRKEYNEIHQHHNEDEILKSSLKSEAENVLDEKNLEAQQHSAASDHSSHFSDLQKENIIPDPFNFINTWRKKPLGFTLHNRMVKSNGVDHPAKLSSSNIPFEEMYKSMLNTSSEQTNPSESTIHETPQDVLSQGEETSSDIQKENFISRTDTLNEIPSNVSVATAGSSKISTSKSSISSKKLSEKPTPSKSESQTNINDPTVNDISETSSGKQAASCNSTTKRKHTPKQSIEKIPDMSSGNLSEMILSGTINSEYTLETEKGSSAVIGTHSSNTSDVILSGTILSEYTLDRDDEESVKEEIEEFTKEHSNEKASVSESSISEVVSVVENSKGFRSSAEDLLSNRSMLSNDLRPSVHSSANNKPITSDNNSSSHVLKKDAVLQSDLSSLQDQQSLSLHSSKALKNGTELTTLLQKNNQFQRIPSASQNSVTIDFRPPLQLTLSNGKSVQPDEELNNIHESQYLHTQVVTRVASEAAAAAATSAVIAVFETQKALLAEKYPFGIMNAYGRSSSSKKTQYSSDFESSADAKSLSSSVDSNAAINKQPESIAEDPPASSNNEISPRDESVEEQILSNHSSLNQMVQSKSSHGSSIKTEGNQPLAYSEAIENENQKIIVRNKRKISSNISSPSPASLSENDSVATETSMSSHSNLSHLSESALSDDFFAQLTLDVVRKMTQEEELRAMHQLASLKFDEQALVQKARGEMALLESLKKKLRQKGAEKKVSVIKKKQKELIIRLRQERVQLQCLQEAYRSRCDKHNYLLKDKKKLLSEPSLLAFELLNKDEKPGTSSYSEQKLKEFYVQKSSSSTSTLSSNNDEKNMMGEDSMSEVPEMVKGLASNSSQESVIESQPSDFTKTSGSSQNKSQRSSPNPPFSPLAPAPSNLNASVPANNSLESMLQGLKKLESSKRHLTKREQRILQRRKKVEHLLQWQKKLDNEEMAVRELEKKALDIVDHSRKKAKYYVSSSGSTNQEDDKRRDLNYESLPPSSETPSKQSEKLPAQYTSRSENKVLKVTSDESIHTDISVNELEAGNISDKGNVQDSSTTHSSGSLPEETKAGSGGSSIHTVETIENGSHSQAEEVASEEISNQVSPSIKDKSSGSDIYSESFESTASRKSPSVLSISSPFKNSSPSKSIKKDYGPGIRLPLVPRNLKRHDSSGSDDSYTISQSETASDQSDIEVRIHALSEEIKRRKVEAEKIKREQKKKNRERLKEKELSLQKQLEAYNQYIHQLKLELDLQIESSASPSQMSDVVVKPRIKWPRPEKVVDSHRVKKQASLSSDTFSLEKKAEIVNSSPEASESHGATVLKEKSQIDEGVRKPLPGPSSKTHEENIIKDVSEKSTDDSKEVSSEILSVDNSSKAQEIPETIPTNSASSEIPSEKVISEIIENVSLSSTKSQDSTENKSSDSDQKLNVTVSSLGENKSSHDSSSSKIETDTFISESISSKSSDLNTLQPFDESIQSNKSISPDDESNAEESSKNSIQKVNVQPLSNTSHEASSSEDSVSEIPSVISSTSLEEKSDCENSKCDGSGGCEASEVTASENEHENLAAEKKELHLLDISSPSIIPVKKNKKRVTSELEVVNLVNYLSTSLFGDAFDNLFEISNKRGVLKDILNHKSSDSKLRADSHIEREKIAEALVHSLLDHQLKDAFTLLFGILENRKTKSQKSVASFSNMPNAKSDMQTVAMLSYPNGLNSSSTTILEESSEFPFNQLSQDINTSNQTLTEAANLNLNYLTTSENEQHFQQQQLLLQQYSYFYRKIPNKPPPPYTPPSSAALSSDFPFVKEKKVEKITTVKKVTKHIDEVLDHALEVILDGKSKGLPLSDISLSTDKCNLDKLELTTLPQSVFVEFVFDLTKEIILQKFSETEQVSKPWLRPRKLTPKPVIPSSKQVLLASIQKDIEKALKVNEEAKNPNRKTQFSWSALKLGRKKRDFVDTILISELKEEEPDWVNYDQDEVTVKLQIADSIFNVLINDTVCTIKNVQQKLQL